MDLKSFYNNKRILITGHTGFKGTWICACLLELGAKVFGYALDAPTNPSLFDLTEMSSRISSIYGDIRDINKLQSVFNDIKPEIVIHMAAQPIVRESYINPVYTYDVNVMGTVNLLECVRNCDSVKSVVNVTTDKVYNNKEWVWAYRENEELNGYDPYSNSKSCSELITDSYRNAFFSEKEIAVSTARAGNVIGGGDFAKDRIVPDCVRSIEGERIVYLRNPDSIRPYQHVMEPIYAYLLLAAEQYEDNTLSGAYNIGPNLESCLTTRQLVDLFCNYWNKIDDRKLCVRYEEHMGPHEAKYLRLDNNKIMDTIGWKPRWDYEEMISKTVCWTKNYFDGKDCYLLLKTQIEDYLGEDK